MPARLALVLATVLLLAAACGGGSEPQSEPPQVAVAQSSSESAEQAPSVDARDDGQQVAQQAPDRDAQVATQQQAAQSANPSAEPAPRDREQTVEVERHRFVEALGGRTFEQPIELLAWPDGGLLVAEQRGSLTVYGQDGSVRGVLDLSDRVTFSDERGLLSVAVDPQFAARPFLYIWYSPRGTHVTRLSRFPVAAGLADRDAELVILEVQQPYSNHNGGALRFGPDGMLYLGIGDGGAANDPHENGQNRGTLLGTIIRIDVSAASEQYRYDIPADNPFLGVPGVRPEIFAYGLRNPWRMAFDPDTGDLWVGDVGQNRVEEVVDRRGGHAIRAGASSKATNVSAASRTATRWSTARRWRRTATSSAARSRVAWSIAARSFPGWSAPICSPTIARAASGRSSPANRGWERRSNSNSSTPRSPPSASMPRRRGLPPDVRRTDPAIEPRELTVVAGELPASSSPPRPSKLPCVPSVIRAAPSVIRAAPSVIPAPLHHSCAPSVIPAPPPSFLRRQESMRSAHSQRGAGHSTALHSWPARSVGPVGVVVRPDATIV